MKYVFVRYLTHIRKPDEFESRARQHSEDNKKSPYMRYLEAYPGS